MAVIPGINADRAPEYRLDGKERYQVHTFESRGSIVVLFVFGLPAQREDFPALLAPRFIPHAAVGHLQPLPVFTRRQGGQDRQGDIFSSAAVAPTKDQLMLGRKATRTALKQRGNAGTAAPCHRWDHTGKILSRHMATTFPSFPPPRRICHCKAYTTLFSIHAPRCTPEECYAYPCTSRSF